MNWSWAEEGEDEEPSVDYMEYLARRASCSVLPDPPKAMVHTSDVVVALRDTNCYMPTMDCYDKFVRLHRWFRLRFPKEKKVCPALPTLLPRS